MHGSVPRRESQAKASRRSPIYIYMHIYIYIEREREIIIVDSLRLVSWAEQRATRSVVGSVVVHHRLEHRRESRT